MYQWALYYCKPRLQQQLKEKEEKLQRYLYNSLIDLVFIGNVCGLWHGPGYYIVFCVLHSLKKELYSHKQRREGHYRADGGSTHDKLQDEYAQLFSDSASRIAERLSKSDMEPVEAKCQMSSIFEVFLSKASCQQSYT